MRRASFRIAGFLTAVLLTVLVAGTASASVALPGGLTAIETEAFMGDRAMTGLVRIPAGVNTVREDAFTDTGVFAMELPATVRTVEAQRLSGLTYMRIESRSADLVSLPDTLKYIASPKGGLVQYYANFHHVDFYPVDTLIADGGFYYVPNDTGLTLLSAVDNSAVPASVTIPENVDGQWVNAVSAYAFAGCPQVTSLALPVATEGHVPASATADCSGARVSYYGNGPLVIKSVKASNEEPLVGETVTFTVEVEGGTAPYTVGYEISKYRTDEVLSTNETEGNSICFTFDESNLFWVSLYAKDANGGYYSSDKVLELSVCTNEFDIKVPETLQAGHNLHVEYTRIQNGIEYTFYVLDKSTGKIYHQDKDGPDVGFCGYNFTTGKTYSVIASVMQKNDSVFVQKEFRVVGNKPNAPIVTPNKTVINDRDDNKIQFRFDLSGYTEVRGLEIVNGYEEIHWLNIEESYAYEWIFRDTTYQLAVEKNGVWTEWSEPVEIKYQPIENLQPPLIAIVEEEIRAGEPITIIIGEIEGATEYYLAITDTNERYSSRIYYATKHRAGTYVLDKIAPSLHAGPFRLTVEAYANGLWSSKSVLDFVVIDQERPKKPTARFQELGEATPTDLKSLESIEKNKEFIADEPFVITIDKNQDDIDNILININYYGDFSNIEVGGATQTLKTSAKDRIIKNKQLLNSSWANHSIPYRVAVSKNGVWSDWSEIIRANLIEKPKWEKQITLLSKRQFKNGENIEISFEPVENADYYRVQLIGDFFPYLLIDDSHKTEFKFEGYKNDSLHNYNVYIAAHNSQLNQESELSVPISIEGNKPNPSTLIVTPGKSSGRRGETINLSIVTFNADQIAINTMRNWQINHQFNIYGEDKNTKVFDTNGDNTECLMTIPFDWDEETIQYSVSVYENGLWTEWSEPITITIVDE